MGGQTYICKDCGKRFRSGKRLDNVSLWHEYLNSRRTLAERTTLTTGGTTYAHRGLRSARKSVNYYLQWLFTFEDYKRLRIPKTTNRLEGVNSRLKRAVKEHNGMNEANKRKVIDAFLNSTKSRN